MRPADGISYYTGMRYIEELYRKSNMDMKEFTNQTFEFGNVPLKTLEHILGLSPEKRHSLRRLDPCRRDKLAEGSNGRHNSERPARRYEEVDIVKGEERVSIRNKMSPQFAKLEGGLFSKVTKADVGDSYLEAYTQRHSPHGLGRPFLSRRKDA